MRSLAGRVGRLAARRGPPVAARIEVAWLDVAQTAAYDRAVAAGDEAAAAAVLAAAGAEPPVAGSCCLILYTTCPARPRPPV